MAHGTEGKTDDDAAAEAGVSLEALRANLGDFVIRAGLRGERIPITRHGKPTAALVSMDDLAQLQALIPAK